MYNMSVIPSYSDVEEGIVDEEGAGAINCGGGCDNSIVRSCASICRGPTYISTLNLRLANLSKSSSPGETLQDDGFISYFHNIERPITL